MSAMMQQQLNQQIFSHTVTAVKRVAIYARVSTTEQERLFNEWCDRNGYIMHEVYAVMGISGKLVKNRLALMRLLDDAKNKKFDVVLVWKTNRLARNILDLLKIVEVFDYSYIKFPILYRKP